MNLCTSCKRVWSYLSPFFLCYTSDIDPFNQVDQKWFLLSRFWWLISSPIPHFSWSGSPITPCWVPFFPMGRIFKPQPTPCKSILKTVMKCSRCPRRCWAAQSHREQPGKGQIRNQLWCGHSSEKSARSVLTCLRIKVMKVSAGPSYTAGSLGKNLIHINSVQIFKESAF